MGRFAVCVVVLGVLPTLQACRRGPSPKADPVVLADVEAGTTANAGAVRDACASFAEQRCATLARCSPMVLSLVDGDEASCRHTEAQICAEEIAPEASNGSAATVAACAAMQGSCEAAVHGSEFDCVVAGPSQDGAPCATNAECAGRFCRRSGGSCGVCARMPSLGEACADGILCDGHLACVDGRCMKRPSAGEACEHDCAPPSVCGKGVCTPPARLGQRCDVLGKAAADCADDLVCVDGECRGIALAGVGERCGGNTLCKGGSQCLGDRCVPARAEGEACDGQVSCARPLRCVAGECVRLSRARCVK